VNTKPAKRVWSFLPPPDVVRGVMKKVETLASHQRPPVRAHGLKTQVLVGLLRLGLEGKRGLNGRHAWVNKLTKAKAPKP